MSDLSISFTRIINVGFLLLLSRYTFQSMIYVRLNTTSLPNTAWPSVKLKIVVIRSSYPPWYICNDLTPYIYRFVDFSITILFVKHVLYELVQLIHRGVVLGVIFRGAYGNYSEVIYKRSKVTLKFVCIFKHYFAWIQVPE